MGRAPCCDKANVKKGPWSPEEDAKLKDYIEKFGTGGNWISLPQKAGLKRCGKSCRLRWLNYLRPNIKHGEFSDEEDRIICTLYASMGSRWSIIASQLPGRTDNDIKNYWNTKLKKKLMMGMNIIPSNKFPQPFSSSTFHQTPQSHLYNSSFFSQSTKSVIDPQNYLYCNSNNFPLSTTQYPNYHLQQEGNLVNLQYNNFALKDNNNMLMFGGGNETSCSSSDTGSCKKNQLIVKQEELECLINHQENQKFMLHYNNGKINAGGDPFSVFLDHDDSSSKISANIGMINNNNHVEINNMSQLQYDIEEVKQLVSSSGNGCNNNDSSSSNIFLYNDENKTHDQMYCYY